MSNDTQARTMDCPDCGNMVSKRAVTCPHCGAPVEAFIEVEATGTNEIIALDSNRFLIGGQNIQTTFDNILTGLDKSVIISGQYPETGKIDIALQSGADFSICLKQELRGAIVEVNSSTQISQPLFFRNVLSDLAVMEFVAVRNKVILAFGGAQAILSRFPENNTTGIIKITRKSQLVRGSVNVFLEPDLGNVKGTLGGGNVLEFSYPVGKYIVAVNLVQNVRMKNSPPMDWTWCQVHVEENSVTDIFVSTTGNGLTGVNLVLEASLPSPSSLTQSSQMHPPTAPSPLVGGPNPNQIASAPPSPEAGLLMPPISKAKPPVPPKKPKRNV